MASSGWFVGFVLETDTPRSGSAVVEPKPPLLGTCHIGRQRKVRRIQRLSLATAKERPSAGSLFPFVRRFCPIPGGIPVRRWRPHARRSTRARCGSRHSPHHQHLTHDARTQTHAHATHASLPLSRCGHQTMRAAGRLTAWMQWSFARWRPVVNGEFRDEIAERRDVAVTATSRGRIRRCASQRR